MTRLARALLSCLLLSLPAAAQTSIVQASVTAPSITVNASSMALVIPSNGGGGSVGGYLVNTGASLTYTCASSFDNARTFVTSFTDSPCVVTPANTSAATSTQNRLVLVGDSNSYRIAITAIPPGATHIELISTSYSSGTSVLTLASAGGGTGGGGTSGTLTAKVYGISPDGSSVVNGVVIAGADGSGNTLTVSAGTQGNISGVNSLLVGGTDGFGNQQQLGIGTANSNSPSTVLLVGSRDTSDFNFLQPLKSNPSGDLDVNINASSVALTSNIQDTYGNPIQSALNGSNYGLLIQGQTPSGSAIGASYPVVTGGVDNGSIIRDLSVSTVGTAAGLNALQIGGTDSVSNIWPLGIAPAGQPSPVLTLQVGGVTVGGMLAPLSMLNGGALITNSRQSQVAHFSGSISITGSPTLVLDNDYARIGGFIQNTDVVPVICGFDNTFTATTGFAIGAGVAAYDGTGGSSRLDPGYNGPIYCLAASGSAHVYATDF